MCRQEEGARRRVILFTSIGSVLTSTDVYAGRYPYIDSLEFGIYIAVPSKCLQQRIDRFAKTNLRSREYAGFSLPSSLPQFMRNIR